MYKMEFQWKEQNVDLTQLDQQLRASYPEYSGNQAGPILELWFTSEPSQADKDAIGALWAEIDADHALVQSYKSMAQVEADLEAKKASAKAKLAALGLTEAELKALLG